MTGLRPRLTLLTLVLGVVTAAVAAPAAADWLVMQDGTRLETAGPWEVRGRLVVFQLADGNLSSLRLAEIDLPASELATSQPPVAPEEPATAEEPPRRRARVVITDADIPRAAPTPATEPAAESEGEAGEAAGEAGEEGAAAPAPGTGLAVTSWEQVDSPGGEGVQIYGTLQNQARRMATDLGMQVLLYDGEGRLIDAREAVIAREALPPAGRANFSVSFVGIYGFAAVKFEPRARGFDLQIRPVDGGDEASLDGEAEGAGGG